MNGKHHSDKSNSLLSKMLIKQLLANCRFFNKCCCWINYAGTSNIRHWFPIVTSAFFLIKNHQGAFHLPAQTNLIWAMTAWGHLLPLGCFNSWNTTMSWGLLRFSARTEISKPLSLLALKIASFSRSVQNTLSCRECTDSWPGLLKSCSSWIKLQQSQSQCTMFLPWGTFCLCYCCLQLFSFYFGQCSEAQHSYKFTKCCVILSSSETKVRELKFADKLHQCCFWTAFSL